MTDKEFYQKLRETVKRKLLTETDPVRIANAKRFLQDTAKYEEETAQ